MFTFKKKKATVATLKPGTDNKDIKPNDNSKSTDDQTLYSISVELGNDKLNDTDKQFMNNLLISRCQYNITKLINNYPAHFAHSHKKTIYKNIMKQSKKNKSKIDPNKISYFTRWKQSNQTDKSLNEINENNSIDDLSAKFKQIFGKNAEIDIETQPETKQNDIDTNKENDLQKSITIHSYEENVFEYTDNNGTVKTAEKKSNDDMNIKIQTIGWYLNFAHSNLFIAYRGVLLAQDELQILEHPFLGSLRECMVNHGKGAKEKIAFLSRESTYATPCLFTNVPRQCNIDTLPNAKKSGREKGLYGNAFVRCKDFKVIESAVNYLSPVTYSNIIAIEAPTGGYGNYSLKDLDYIFYCAFTAFKAAKIESNVVFKKDKNHIIKVVIHTGNWGTGAYGGNKELMSLLQMLAADFAGINELIYHTFSKMFTLPYLNALKVREQYVDKDGNILKDWNFIRNELFEMKYKWGVSDGN